MTHSPLQFHFEHSTFHSAPNAALLSLHPQDTAHNPPLDLVWLVDVSGSMRDILTPAGPSVATPRPPAFPLLWPTPSAPQPVWPFAPAADDPHSFQYQPTPYDPSLQSPSFAADPVRIETVQPFTKLDYVKFALHHYIQRLRPQDRVTLISFSDEARVEWSSTQPMNAQTQHQLSQAVTRLHTRGGTFMQAGLQSALQHYASRGMDGHVRRVLMLSDGEATSGWKHPGDFNAFLTQLRTHAVSLSCMGVGLSYQEALLSHLALEGQGLFAHLQSRDQFERWIAREHDSMESLWAARVWLSVTLQAQKTRSSKSSKEPVKPVSLTVQHDPLFKAAGPQQWTSEILWPQHTARHFPFGLDIPAKTSQIHVNLSIQWQDLHGQVHKTDQSVEFTSTPTLEFHPMTLTVQEQWAIFQSQAALRRSQEEALAGRREAAKASWHQAQTILGAVDTAQTQALRSLQTHYGEQLNNPMASANALSKLACESTFVSTQSYRTQGFKDLKTPAPHDTPDSVLNPTHPSIKP